jgi:hypothetical protein
MPVLASGQIVNLKGKVAVIGQPYGGLGDNLQFSTLPAMFARHGIETWISSKNICRNPQIYELAWGLNPYVKGIKDEPPNVYVGDVEKSAGYGELNTVQRAEMLYFGKWEHQFPVTFYQPKYRPDFANKAVLEFGFVTVDLNPVLSRIRSELEYMLDGQEVVLLRNPVNASLDVGKFPEYSVQSIYELADILYSCRLFAGIESGAAVLCATLKKDQPRDGIYVFCRHIHLSAKAFVYPNQTLVEVL